MALRDYVYSICAGPAAVEGVSEDFYFLRQLIQNNDF